MYENVRKFIINHDFGRRCPVNHLSLYFLCMGKNVFWASALTDNWHFLFCASLLETRNPVVVRRPLSVFKRPGVSLPFFMLMLQMTFPLVVLSPVVPDQFVYHGLGKASLFYFCTDRGLLYNNNRESTALYLYAILLTAFWEY